MKLKCVVICYFKKSAKQFKDEDDEFQIRVNPFMRDYES